MFYFQLHLGFVIAAFSFPNLNFQMAFMSAISSNPTHTFSFDSREKSNCSHLLLFSWFARSTASPHSLHTQGHPLGSSRQRYSPSPTLPEPSNFGSPPAAPEDYLSIELHRAIIIPGLSRTWRWRRSQEIKHQKKQADHQCCPQQNPKEPAIAMFSPAPVLNWVAG